MTFRRTVGCRLEGSMQARPVSPLDLNLTANEVTLQSYTACSNKMTTVIVINISYELHQPPTGCDLGFIPKLLFVHFEVVNTVYFPILRIYSTNRCTKLNTHNHNNDGNMKLHITEIHLDFFRCLNIYSRIYFSDKIADR
jgi:hypothetical protein